MAKELPYFRFTAAEWLNGDISLEATYLKGVFIDICSYYWFKDCSLTKTMLKKKYSRDVDAIKDLIELDILKHDEETDYLTINFLNEQYDLLSEQRKRRQDAGSKGGKQKSSNATAKLKQSPSYKDNDNDKYNDKEYSNEIKNFTGSILTYFPILPKKIESWYEITDKLIRIDNYDLNTIEIIVKYFRADSFWIDNFQSYTKLRKKKDEGLYIDYFKNILISKSNGTNQKNSTSRNTTAEGLNAIISQFPDSQNRE